MNTEMKIAAALNGIVDVQSFLVGMRQKETIAERMIKSGKLEKVHEGRSETG